MYLQAYERLGQDQATVTVLSSNRSWLQSILEEPQIKAAIEQGVRDLNKLTNLVFFARHPERQGRKLARTEPMFEQLAQEWLDIRDNVVHPILEKLKSPPQKTRTTPTSGRSVQDGGLTCIYKPMKA